MSSEPATGRLETLLAEASWLEGLARALVRDREEARDLVQEVWVAAAERAPARIERPRAWLAEVLRNALRSRRRAQGSRETRERARARDAAVSGAGDVVARAEAQRALVEHVLALDEPWRSTVLLRFFDGLSGEEIARRTREPASTVRNRLAHALELLRGRLERSRGTDWMAGIILLARPSVAARSPARSGESIPGLAGSKVALTATALAGLAGLGLLRWFPWSSAARSDDLSAAVERARPSSRDERTRPVSEARPAGRTALRESMAVASPDEDALEAPAEDRAALLAGCFAGIVLEDGKPTSRRGTVELALDWVSYLQDVPAGARRGSLAGDGRFRFDGSSAGTNGVRVTLEGLPVVHTGVFLPEDRGEWREVHVGHASLDGFVWDEEGRPVADARIVLTWSSDDPESTVVQETFLGASDASGRYSFAGLPAGRLGGGLRLQASDGDGETHYFTLVPPLARGEGRRLDFGAPRPWPRWTGTLRARTGAAHLGGAALLLKSPSGNPSLWKRSIAEDGRFDLRLPPGHYALQAEIRLFDRTPTPLGELDITGEIERDLVLPGARVSGRVFLAATRARLPDRDPRLIVSVRSEGQDHPSSLRQAWAGADGSFAIDALEPGVYLLNTHPLVIAGGKDSLRFELAPGQDELVLEVGVRAP